MRCNQCGHENAARDRFCGKCGRPLAAISPAQPPPAPPAPPTAAPSQQPPPPQPAASGRVWVSRGLLAMGLAVGAIVILVGVVLVVVLARDPILELIGRSGSDGQEEGAAVDIPALTSTPTPTPSREVEPTATAPPPTATVTPEPTAPPPTPTLEPASDLKDAIVGRWRYECDMVSDPGCLSDMLIVFTNQDKVFFIEFAGEEDYYVEAHPFSVKGDEITMQVPAEEGGPGVWRVIEVSEEILVVEVVEYQEMYHLVRDRQEVPDSLPDGILGSWMTLTGDNEIPVIYEFADDETLKIYLLEPEMLLCRGSYSLPAAGTVWMNIACVDSETGEFGEVAFVIYEDGLFINEFQFVIFKEPPGQHIFTRVDDWPE